MYLFTPSIYIALLIVCFLSLSNLIRSGQLRTIVKYNAPPRFLSARHNDTNDVDLTVLLVNDQKRNDYNSKLGRYHSVKPLIGLLTSTARTFIQDGVTTEFATQILGTTLNNGRIYAQLLTKSSLIIYNKPANDDAVTVNPLEYIQLLTDSGALSKI